MFDTRRAALSLSLLAALLVAGAAGAAVPLGRYRITSDTVFDTETRLTWERAGSPATVDWPGAVTYCLNLALAGGGWRLPTIRELESLADVRDPSGGVSASAFPGAAWGYWSSTVLAGDATQAWSFLNLGGKPATNSKTLSGLAARCVR